MQVKIVHGADVQDTLPRETGAAAVHERAARGTEAVSHSITRGDGVRLDEGLQVIAAAQVLQVRIGDGKVECEHGRGDVVAVRAVAYEIVNQVRALGWLGLEAVLEQRRRMNLREDAREKGSSQASLIYMDEQT